MQIFRQQSEPNQIKFTVLSTPSKENPISLSKIKPEIYKAELSASVKPPSPNGRLLVSLAYEAGAEKLTVRVIKALDLPAKDFSGTSDPYVKIYVLPDRKTKCQTKVHRKDVNPVFDETFEFNSIVSQELQTKTVVFVVYDFDRFSKHDLIGTGRIDLADTDLISPRNFTLELQNTPPSHQVFTQNISLFHCPSFSRFSYFSKIRISNQYDRCLGSKVTGKLACPLYTKEYSPINFPLSFR